MKTTPAARLRLLAGTALAATTVVAAPVFAQSSDDGARGLQEIIVTAQKREQSLQDVPIAVSAVAGEALTANRVTNVVDLSAIAPGVTVRPSLGASSIPSFTIRGAVSFGVVPGSDKQVSMYLDGVYLSSPRGAIFDLPNVERIEMLRGPQGTLFGRNATAGAVSIMTQDPKGEASVKAGVSMGNLDLWRYELTAHTPELGPLSGYFSYVKSKHRGSTRNGLSHVFDRNANALKYNRFARSAKWLGSKDSDSVFASVKFESGDFRAVYKYDRNDSAQTPDPVGIFEYNAVPGLGALFGNYVNAIIAGNVANGLPIASDRKRPKEVWNSYSTTLDVKNFGHNLTFTYQLSDQISIKNIAAFRSSEVQSTASLLGLDALPIPASAIDEFATLTAFSTVPGFATLPPAQQGAILANLQTQLAGFTGRVYCVFCSGPNSRSKQWSDELQLNYDSSFLTLTVGAMYFLGKDHINEHGMQNTVTFTALPVGNAIPYLPGIGYNEAESIAAYAQGEIHVTPQLDIVLGGRFTKDKKIAELTSLTTATCPATITDSAQLKNCPLNTSVFNYKDTKFNYLIGVNFKPTDDILVYAKYSTAYVSGGKVGPIEFVPETTKAGELGVKADLLNRRLRTNLAVFWNKYYDYQTAQGGNVFPQDQLAQLVPDIRVRNALGTFVFPQGDIEAKGFELEVTAAPADGIVLGGSLSYTDVKFSNVPALLKQASNIPGTAPDSAYLPTFRPDWTGSAYAQYTSQPIWGEATFTARIQGNYQSKMTVHPNATIETIFPQYTKSIPGYWLFNARAAIENFDVGALKATIALWGKNITNNRSISFGFNQVGIASGTFIEPRRYGVDLTVEF
jgi:iron complex outermembrane receptor protein